MDQKAQNSILYTVLISQFSMPFMFSGIAVTLPIMGKEMNASGVALSLVEIVFLGTSGALMLPFGKLADMTNKQAVYKTGLLSTAITTLILGLVQSIDIFIFFRLIQGLTFALIVSTNMAIITETMPKKQLGKSMGLSIGAVYAGLSVGPFVAGIVTEYVGWRWIYYIVCFLLLVAYIQSSRYLKGKWIKPEKRYDYFGALIIVSILAFWIIGSSKLNQGYLGIILLLTGVFLLPLLVIVEQKAIMPLLEFHFLRTNLIFSKALIIQLLTYSGTFGVPFLFSLYLQVVKQYSPRDTGLILMTSPVLMAIMAPFFGRLSDRINPRRLATFGVFFTLIGTFLATWITIDVSIYWLCLVLACHGIGFAMFSSPNMKIIMTSVDRSRTGVASALAAEMRTLGMVVSMLLITLFMSLLIGSSQISVDSAGLYLKVMQYSLIAISILGGLAFVMSVFTHTSTKAVVTEPGNK
jgi:MFS family permease